MEFLYLLEKIRMPWLDELMLLITRLGEETTFLVAALILYWCVDKRKGYYIMAVGFIGTIANQFLKLWCRVLRPWDLDPNFNCLEAAKPAATGYSFPSGHSQSAVGTFGGIAMSVKQKWLRAVCIAIAILVPFSRMYVGVHTPQDVLVGSGMALVLLLVMKPVVFREDGKGMNVLLPVMIVISVAYLLFVELYPFPADTLVHNLESGTKNAYTLLGSLLGLLVAYWFDQKKLHFDVKAIWWAQLLKIAGGLALVLAVKAGLKPPLNALFAGHHAATALRYFAIVVVAGVIWPMTFPWFARLGKKEEHK